MTDTPNFEARITAAEEAYAAVLKEIAFSKRWEVVAVPSYVMEAAEMALTSVQQCSAILRDYARRAEGE